MKSEAPHDSWAVERIDRVLACLPWLQANAELRHALISAGNIVRFQPGETLIQQGSEDQDVFFLLRGAAEVTVFGVRVAERREGQHVGEMVAINPSAARSASVTATTPVIALRISALSIEDIANTHPSLWRSFATELARRLEQRGKVVERMLEIQREENQPTGSDGREYSSGLFDRQPPNVTAAANQHLSPDTTRVLRVAAIEAQLDEPERRELLFLGIDRRYLADLPRKSAPGDQLQSDLQQMNRCPRLASGVIPLQSWLKNALDYLAMLPDLRKPFESALRELEGKITSRGANEPPSEPERIIHRNDLLPVWFAEGLLRAAHAVAHLEVPAYRGGKPLQGGAGQPLGSRGTGWLITPSLLVTAYHVVRVHSPADLMDGMGDVRLQVAGARARFDYHDVTALAGDASACAELAAWDEALDYAVIQLGSPSRAPSLALASCPLNIPATVSVPFPANIIQHPGGGPKMLGIRNNLLTRHDTDHLWYFTDTDRGSSGAPVLNDRWQVIAVHCRSDPAGSNVVFQGQPTAWVNCGTRIDRILQHIQQRFPTVWSEIEASTEAARESEPA